MVDCLKTPGLDTSRDSRRRHIRTYRYIYILSATGTRPLFNFFDTIAFSVWIPKVFPWISDCPFWAGSRGVAIVGNVGFLQIIDTAPPGLLSSPSSSVLAHLHHRQHDKMSDRETLLSMGFDAARVDCEHCFLVLTYILHLTFVFWDIPYAGALKATNNRGLQSAMDHLIENQDNPVPDLSSVSSTATSTRPPGGGDPMDEDEDLEALRAVYGPGAGGSNPTQGGAEAKVPSGLPPLTRSLSC